MAGVWEVGVCDSLGVLGMLPSSMFTKFLFDMKITVLPCKYQHAVISEVYQNDSHTRLVTVPACRYRARVPVYSGEHRASHPQAYA